MIILHHYPTSPWAEVLRLALGLKGVEWESVTAPVIMPKPDLCELTGGYARIPVLQIGADIYCDTAAGIDAIEAAYPEPSLFPAPLGQGHRLLAQLAQGPVFFAAVGAALGVVPAEGMAEFWADREKRFGMKPAAFKAIAPQLMTQFSAHLGLLEAALSDGRAFLGGPSAGHGDLAHFQLLWFQQMFAGGTVSALTARRPALAGWCERVAAIGHGHPVEIMASAAIDKARSANPQVTEDVAPSSGFTAGQQVLVSQEGSADAPVSGALKVLTDRRITIVRSSPKVGEVAVHFPRLGQVVSTG